MFTSCCVATLVGLEGPMLSSLVFKGNYAIGVEISGHKCRLSPMSPNFTVS